MSVSDREINAELAAWKADNPLRMIERWDLELEIDVQMDAPFAELWVYDNNGNWYLIKRFDG